MKDNQVFCTIFTPTYNRLHTIGKLYKSLLKQTDNDFEWVVIDDGSEDGTEEWFHEIQETQFPIIYKKVANGGKHRAINIGLDVAAGKVFAIVDSDDYIAENTIEKLKEMFRSIEDIKDNFCGVAGLKVSENGSLVGTTFNDYFVDAKSTEREKYNIRGDKFEVFYTELLRENKFPEFKGENFLTEAVVWFRLSRKGYLIRWFNEPLYYCEYLSDGLTSKQSALYANNPKGYALFMSERLKDNLRTSQKLVYLCNYYDLMHSRAKLRTMATEIDQPVFKFYISLFARLVYRTVKRNHTL